MKQDGKREAILARIQMLIEEAGTDELELLLIFLDTYLRKKQQKRAGR